MRNLLIGMAIYVFSGLVHGAEIARWTDAEGNLYFGNPQFAPAGMGETVVVKSANGMDRPASPRRPNRARPFMATVKKAAKRNPQGFRGFSQRRNRAR